MCQSVFLFVLALPSVYALAQSADFSAEMVESTKGDAQPLVKKVNVLGERIKLMDVTPNQRKSDEYILIDLRAKKMYFVVPDHQAYVDVSDTLNTTQGSPWFLLRPHDPDGACRDWQQLRGNSQPALTCRRVGIEVVNGRSAVKYEATEIGKTNKGYLWIDERLGFYLKIQDDKSVLVLQNIDESPQPASLFEIPARFQKMDIRDGFANRDR